MVGWQKADVCCDRGSHQQQRRAAVSLSAGVGRDSVADALCLSLALLCFHRYSLTTTAALSLRNGFSLCWPRLAGACTRTYSDVCRSSLAAALLLTSYILQQKFRPFLVSSTLSSGLALSATNLNEQLHRRQGSVVSSPTTSSVQVGNDRASHRGHGSVVARKRSRVPSLLAPQNSRSDSPPQASPSHLADSGSNLLGVNDKVSVRVLQVCRSEQGFVFTST